MLSCKKYQINLPASFLNLQEAETYFECFESKNTTSILRLKHSAEAFALNLKAYISTVLPMLKCLMDFQITDGRAMLLKYVTSCYEVARWHKQ
jgi:hypothetical protein